MFKYILRRSAYSVLVVLGVVLLTFLLFDLASGDPAAAVLGKNARPEEIELLRRELGADLPLFFGHLCRSEAVAARDFAPGDREIVFRRQFRTDNIVCRVDLSSGDQLYIDIPDAAEEFIFPLKPGASVEKVEVFRRQKNPFNSRIARALTEIISFQRSFPFVKVLDFGRTITTREPISGILRRSILPSLALMVPIFLGELIFSLIFALISVAFMNKWVDHLLVVLAVSGMSISYLAVIIFSQYYFGYYLELFPLWGCESWKSFGLPVLVGVLCGIGGNLRFYRTVLAGEIHREYLRTATAKGLPPGKVYGKHLLRNTALQVITRSSGSIPFLFTGSLLLESFFGIPGLGFAGVDALYNSDIQLLKAIVVLGALLFVVINLLADLAYAWADPRIRLE